MPISSRFGSTSPPHGESSVRSSRKGHRERADALLERIVATPADAVLLPRGRTRGRLVWVSVIVAVIAIGSVALRRTEDSGVAYASWTPAPSAVAPGDLDTVVGACRDQLHDGTIPVALAERRGAFVAVLFHRNNPDVSASCVAWNRPGSTQVDDVATAVGGSSGPAWTPAAGRITQGMVSDYGGDPPAAFTEGAVGRDVVGVTIHAGTRTITATVENGRYAAWWPGTALSDGPASRAARGAGAAAHLRRPHRRRDREEERGPRPPALNAK
jgi:hypothetical protein